MARRPDPADPFASPDEINPQEAEAAFAGTSHVPARRGEQIRQEYARTLNAFHERILATATTPQAQAAIAEALTDAKRRYRTAFLGWLHSRARTTSVLVTGPSGRNVRREQKKITSADKRGAELSQILPTATARIQRLLKQHRIDAAGGPVANEQNKLAAAEARQAQMVAANRIVRKKLAATDKAAQLAALGISEPAVRQLLKPDYMGRLGFPPYELKNNNANIKRLRVRVAELQTRESRAGQEATEHPFTGSPAFPYSGTIVYDYEDNRIRVRFDARLPREKFRELTRTTGFVWSRKNQAFQHIMGPRGAATTAQITGATSLPDLRQAVGATEPGARQPGDRSLWDTADRVLKRALAAGWNGRDATPGQQRQLADLRTAMTQVAAGHVNGALRKNLVRRARKLSRALESAQAPTRPTRAKTPTKPPTGPRRARKAAATRRFANEVYTLRDTYPSKADATAAAGRSRAAGYPSRVVGRKGGWSVYALQLSQADADARKTCTALGRRRRQAARARIARRRR